jgi:hypothetical protein
MIEGVQDPQKNNLFYIMQLTPVQIHPPGIAVIVPTKPFKGSPWRNVTYDLHRNNNHFEEAESTLKKSSSLTDLAKLSSDLMRINQSLPEKDILMKRSSSLSRLEDLPSDLIQANKVEEGFEEIFTNRLQKLTPSEKLDDNKLLEGAQSIRPRDMFITANQHLSGLQMTSSLSRDYF